MMYYCSQIPRLLLFKKINFLWKTKVHSSKINLLILIFVFVTKNGRLWLKYKIATNSLSCNPFLSF